MQLAKISDIVTPERQRKLFASTAISTLAESIAEKGLLHPLVCKAQGGKLRLVAGERRLRAIKELQSEGVLISCNDLIIDIGLIPYILIGAATFLITESL